MILQGVRVTECQLVVLLTANFGVFHFLMGVVDDFTLKTPWFLGFEGLVFCRQLS